MNLVEGQDIRDHYQNVFQNIIGDPPLGIHYIHTFSFNGNVRLDELQFILPTSFNSATLTDIILHSTSISGYPNGEPFMAAAGPVSTVPEPSSVVMATLAAGLVLAGRWMGRGRRP